jgi:hypothetical protein
MTQKQNRNKFSSTLCLLDSKFQYSLINLWYDLIVGEKNPIMGQEIDIGREKSIYGTRD